VYVRCGTYTTGSATFPIFVPQPGTFVPQPGTFVPQLGTFDPQPGTFVPQSGNRQQYTHRYLHTYIPAYITQPSVFKPVASLCN
jgi:hypothetical protein